ncbi:unnamed protein product [Diabrotica balteata]|uniref:Thyroglobulin type-1 domain-containing protein n=1 Tax=Diabrotica balteata TaxID=107213 RepID=A0A9N9T6F0_DIABA|nr:unnamed protein product [Diabrotica balteata]
MKVLLFILVFLLCRQECLETCNDILVTDFCIDDCIALQTSTDSYFYAVDTKTCLPGCQMYADSGYLRKNCPCPPAYMCAKRCSASNAAVKVTCKVDADCSTFPWSRCQDTCVPDLNSCMAYHTNTSDFRYNKFTALKFKPACQDDGYWKAKQCKGGVSGRCMCFDKHGKRLFGEAKHSKSADMTCACSRRKAELLESGRDYVSLHCNSLGNYEKLQCDSGLCWCAEEKTGDLVSTIVPEKAMNKLPCYEVATTGSQYLKQCDSIAYAMAKTTRALKNHGVTYINLGIRLCDGDGAYGVYNVSDGIAYCTWRDGSKISTYQSNSESDFASLTCRCARDYVLYRHGLRCEGSGNYRAYQSILKDDTDYYYCVDTDGFQNSNLFDKAPENCSIYY